MPSWPLAPVIRIGRAGMSEPEPGFGLGEAGQEIVLVREEGGAGGDGPGQGEFLGAADELSLAGLDGLHEGGGLEQGIGGSGVEPGGAAAEALDGERAIVEIEAVEIGDLELAAGRPSSALISTSGMSFSGNCQGP